MTGDFREPVVWLLLSIVASGIVHVIAFILLDQDLVSHDQAEVGVEYQVGAHLRAARPPFLPYPDTGRVKGRRNYPRAEIVAAIFSFGLYLLWWFHDMMVEPNFHFYTNWVQEDTLAVAVQAMQ